MLQLYLIFRKRQPIYFPTTNYGYRFSDYLFHLFFTFSLAIFHHDSQYLATTVMINRYRTLRVNKISSNYQKIWSYPISPILWFINFTNIWVTPYHLYCDSLTLLIFTKGCSGFFLIFFRSWVIYKNTQEFLFGFCGCVETRPVLIFSNKSRSKQTEKFLNTLL